MYLKIVDVIKTLPVLEEIHTNVVETINVVIVIVIRMLFGENMDIVAMMMIVKIHVIVTIAIVEKHILKFL